MRFTRRPPKHCPKGRYTDKQSLIGTGVGKDGHTERHPKEVASSEGMPNSRNRTKHKRTADCGQRTARISIDPVAEQPNPKDKQYAAEQGPAGRQPGLKHPADGSTHHSDAD